MAHDHRQQGTPIVSDQSALVTKLIALAESDTGFVGSARIISVSGMPAPLAAMIDEIDTTVLERALSFDIDGVILRIAVAGRRLRGVIDIAGVPQSAKTLTGKVLSQDDVATTQAVGTLLSELCKDARQVTVESFPAEALGNPSEAGVPASALANLWQVAPADAPQSKMTRFLTVNAATISAFVHAIDGTVAASQGDTGKLDPIWRDQFAAFRKRQKAIFPRQDGPLLVCLDHALGDGRATAVAVAGEETSVFAYEPTAISAILASWRLTTK